MKTSNYYQGIFDGYFAVKRLWVFVIAVFLGMLGVLFNLIKSISYSQYKKSDPEYIVSYIYVFYRTILRYSFYGYIIHIILSVVLLTYVIEYALNIYSLIGVIIFLIL